MKREDLYPNGTIKQTSDFAMRQKIKKIISENVEEIIKSETINAFKKAGYKENDGFMYVSFDKEGKELWNKVILKKELE